MTDGKILVDLVDGSTAVVTMSREDKRNALTARMSADLVQVFHELDERPDVRTIVLTGAGTRAFTAGHDLVEALEGDPGVLFTEPNLREFMVPGAVSTPVISAVNGAAYAGGFCLAIASDLRIASPTAVFASPGARLGIVPSGGQLAMLPYLLPPAVTAQLLMTGSTLTADQALQWGFVSEVVGSDLLVDRACEMARTIARMSPDAILSIKRVLRATLTEGYAAGNAMEFWRAQVAGIGADVEEGLAAFVERRDPVFPAAPRAAADA